MFFYLLKRKSRLKPATTAQFLKLLPPCCKNPSTVLEFPTSRSLYDDALTCAARGHPTARGLERRRQGSAGQVDPARATRIAPAGPPFHEPGTHRPHSPNHRDPQ